MKKKLNEKFPPAMKWCNMHPRYFPITPPFVPYPSSKSVGFKCI